MSRKTRKEKVIAELRRKLKASHEQSLPQLATKAPQGSSLKNTQPAPNLPENIPPFSSSPNSSSLSQTQSLYIYPLQLIKKDLTKTVFLCILTISLEIALFFLLENR